MSVNNFLWIHNTAKLLQNLLCSKCSFEVVVCLDNGHRQCLNGCIVVWGSFLERVKYFSLTLTCVLFSFSSADTGNFNLYIHFFSIHLLFILQLPLPLPVWLLPCQFADLFLLRPPLTSMSLNVTSNYQLYLIWFLISTNLCGSCLFHWLRGHSQSPLFPSTFMNMFHRFCCRLLFFCVAVLKSQDSLVSLFSFM